MPRCFSRFNILPVSGRVALSVGELHTEPGNSCSAGPSLMAVGGWGVTTAGFIRAEN